MSLSWSRDAIGLSVFAVLCTGVFAWQSGCGSSGSRGTLGEGGTYDADASGAFAGDDASAPGALGAHIEDNHVSVTFITLTCAGDCADVQAVATGGHAPYTFAWDDGSTNPARHVCPTSSTSYHVKVTDTARTGELAQAADTAQATLTANLLACPDASVPGCDEGGGDVAVAPGHYVGTVYCPPDGGVLSLPSADGGVPVTGSITLDLAIHGTTVDGSLYFLWTPSVIAIQASLQGTPDCSQGGALTWTDGVWGLPGTGPDGGMRVNGTGTASGEITVTPVSGTPGAIGGVFDYLVSTGFCHGNYAATLQP
jgi:hypothetical protein